MMMNETEKMANELANNLRTKDFEYAQYVAKILDIDANENLLKQLCSYWFRTKQDDVFKILEKAGQHLENIDFLKKCLEL